MGNEILLVISFLVHAAFMNLVLGGTFIMVVTHWVATWKGDRRYAQLADKMATIAPTLMLLTVGTGLVSWLFVQAEYSGAVRQVLTLLGMGWPALAGLLIAGFVGLWAYRRWCHATPRKMVRGLLLGVGVWVCLLSLTGIFVMGHILGINPMVWSQVEQAGLVTALDLPTLWPRFLHLVLAALAGTGIILTLHGTLRAQNPAEENVSDTQSWVSHDVWLTRYGAAWTLTGTLPQIVIGPWLLVSLPPEVRAHLLSGGNSASILFFVSLTLALLALVLLNASMMVPQIRWLAWTGMASLVGTIFLMIIVREEVRQAWLAIL